MEDRGVAPTQDELERAIKAQARARVRLEPLFAVLRQARSVYAGVPRNERAESRAAIYISALSSDLNGFQLEDLRDVAFGRRWDRDRTRQQYTANLCLITLGSLAIATGLVWIWVAGRSGTDSIFGLGLIATGMTLVGGVGAPLFAAGRKLSLLNLELRALEGAVAAKAIPVTLN